MNVTLNTTKDYGNFRIETMKKQTQTNPILSAVGGLQTMHQPPPTSYLGAGSLCRFTLSVLRKFFNKKVVEAIQVDKAFTKNLKKLTERAGFEPAVQVYARTTV